MDCVMAECLSVACPLQGQSGGESAMPVRWSNRVASGLLGAFVWLLTCLPPATAMHQILPEAVVEADRTTVLELTSTFDRAEEAIRARNLDALMDLYAGRYHYHSLTKADIRKIWADLFERYENLSNMHTFSFVRIVGSGPDATAEIACTGALYGTSKDTKLQVPLDSWFQETHYLVKEEGVWRILGNAGGESRPALPFGTAPHPLF
jgi:hypothetical protein